MTYEFNEVIRQCQGDELCPLCPLIKTGTTTTLSWIAERLGMGSESNASRQCSRINDLPDLRNIKAAACKIEDNAGIKD
jgi:hypothetical protein